MRLPIHLMHPKWGYAGHYNTRHFSILPEATVNAWLCATRFRMDDCEYDLTFSVDNTKLLILHVLKGYDP